MYSLCVCVCCSAIIEHTNKVIFLEDEDIARTFGGTLNIHRMSRAKNDVATREVVKLQMELQHIMKGERQTLGPLRHCLVIGSIPLRVR